MRKLKLYIAVSLDGYIARRDDSDKGGIDWLFTDADYGYTEFYESIDTALVGRRTYNAMQQLGEPFYEGKQTLVFSQTLTARDVPEQVEIISASPVETVKRLREESGKDLWLVGGGKLIKPLAEAGLIDEYHLSIHPVLLGDGIPLFDKFNTSLGLKLRSVKNYDSGLVQLVYEKS